MREIKIKHLPPVTIANIVALVRIVSVMLAGVVNTVYFRAFFGPRVELAKGASVSGSLFVYKYLIPILLAWVSGFFACTVFNALAKRGSVCLSVETEE